MSLDEVLAVARDGQALGCKEALFTLGDQPEVRWPAARSALDEMGFASTIDYLEHVAERVGTKVRSADECESPETIAPTRCQQRDIAQQNT